MALEDIRNERIKKVAILKDKGVDPYPASFEKNFSIGQIISSFSSLLKKRKKINIAGRIMAKREHGGATFIDLRDETGKIQSLLKKDSIGSASYDLFKETVDIGDFILVGGKPFITKKGEKTLEASNWRMLSKSLRPLPEKWHGLQDVEERFRKRYLDLIINDGVRARFYKRSEIIHMIREFFYENSFIEVETPELHHLAGGALAKPFITHHKSLDIDLFLRIAPELYLKRLLIGGMEKFFEIGRQFRNEGIDATHNPEFTMLEAYAAYWDEDQMMKFVEKLFIYLVKKINKKNKVISDGEEILIKAPFPRITFKNLLARYALITDYERETRDTLATRAKQLGIETEPHEPKGKIADEIYKKVCRPRIKLPTFLTNHPLDISPLAKKSLKDPNEVLRFQLIIAGVEVVNGFSELNDPIDQLARFQEQEKTRQRGEDEAHRMDEDFVEAMEYGMPPAAGIGIGIDRLVMLLADVKNIREVLLFPTMRPKE